MSDVSHSDLIQEQSRIKEIKDTLDRKINAYERTLNLHMQAIKNTIAPSIYGTELYEKNSYKKNIILKDNNTEYPAYVTKSGYIRKYKLDSTGDRLNYDYDCPATFNNLNTFKIDESVSDNTSDENVKYAYYFNSDTGYINSDIKLKYNTNNNMVKEGGKCKLNYNENIFLYNINESKYSSYEGCLKPNFNNGSYHSDENTYEGCLEETSKKNDKYFSLRRDSNNKIECRSYPTYYDMDLTSDTSDTPERTRSISEQVTTLFDNKDNNFKGTTNLLKNGYKTNLLGVFTADENAVEEYAKAGDHCFLRLCRNGNLKIYRIGKTGINIKEKSLDFFDLHIGKNVRDSNSELCEPIENCDEDIGGYIDETSIDIEWGKECKAKGCFIYQDKGCPN